MSTTPIDYTALAKQYGATSSTPSQQPLAQPSLLRQAGKAGLDVLNGIGAGALSTANNIGKVIYPDVIAKHLTGVPSQQQQDSYFAPQDTAQAIGKGGEQVAEFLLPGGLEKEGAAKLATALPKLGKLAAPVARIATGAASSGLVNKAQGGSFAGGAAAGGAGGAVAEGARAVAPMIAESALGVRAIDRSHGRLPGQMILNETSGVNPGKIAQQASDKMSLYKGQQQTLANNFPGTVDLTPARLIASDAQAGAAAQNNPSTIKRTGELSDLLNKEYGSASAIPPQVSAPRALSLRQGTGDLKSSWNPAVPNKFADAAVGKAYGALSGGIHSAIPEIAPLDNKISGLIPVAARAGASDLNAGFVQRGLSRLTKPTGALIPAGLGASAGAATAGPLGALAGGALGLFGTEAIGSPTSQMIMARTANSALVPPTIRALSGTGLQANRKKGLYEP